jgi:hypothetical protein
MLPMNLDGVDLPDLLDSEIVSEQRARWNGPIPNEVNIGFNPSARQAETVCQLAAVGLRPKEIAKALHIGEKVLMFYYGYEIEAVQQKVNAKVGEVALKMAISGQDSDMTKFWLKSKGGWKETSAVEVSGPDGGPVELSNARSILLGAPDVVQLTKDDESEK